MLKDSLTNNKSTISPLLSDGKDNIKDITKDNLREIYIWLSNVTTFRSRDLEKLHTLFPDLEELRDSLMDEDILKHLAESEIIKEETRSELKSLDFDYCIERVYMDMKETGISCTTPADPDYPSRLMSISDAPLCIYYRGDISLAESDYSVAIVGSRRPTHYGMSVADEFAKGLSDKGITIISGMAYGIDSKAHAGVLDSGGKTIAVLGGGVDICYPRTNMSIYLEMCENQLVLSEYPPHTEHIALHFPKRNRIISGLSDGVLVIEAALRSGTLITTDFALEQGRTIYAIPGRITDMMSKGVNNLIKQGAMLVDSPADIISDLMGIPIKKSIKKSSNKLKDDIVSVDIPTPVSSQNSAQNHKSSVMQKSFTDSRPLSTSEKTILGILGFEPIYIDDIIRANNMNISETIHILRKLESEGYIEVIEQSYYKLIHK